MTAAHAFEYEVPEHGPAPIEAVEQAEGGSIVYLTRAGRRVAAVVPPGQADIDQQTVEAVAKVVTDLITVDADRARTTILNLLGTVPAPATATQQRIREELIDFLDDIGDAPAARRLREAVDHIRRGKTTPLAWDQVKQGLDL